MSQAKDCAPFEARFPYRPIVSISMIAVVAFSFAHTTYTYRTVQALQGPEGNMTMVWAMYGLTMALTIFVGGAIIRRARTRLEITKTHA